MVTNITELHVNGSRLETIAPLGLRLQRYQLSDIPEMVDATEDFCRYHPHYSKIPFSRRKLAAVLEENVDNKRMFCELVWKDGERIAGMAGMVSGYAMSEESFTQDIFHFIREDYRGSVAFPMLIGAYIQWAQSMGAWNAVLSYTGEKVAPLTRMLKKWGFEHFGETYTKSLT